MKQTLNAAQVSENLKQLFSGREIKCTEVINGQFFIETKNAKVVVIGKAIWTKPTIKEWAKYLVYCKENNKMYQKVRTIKGTYIPFIYLPTKNAKQAKNEAEILLQACGLKTKREKDTDIATLHQWGAKGYIEIYKLIKELTVIDSCMEYEQVYAGYGKYKQGKLLLSVTHTKGHFKFPIECITGNYLQDQHIKNIFLNLLGKPVTTKEIELIAA